MGMTIDKSTRILVDRYIDTYVICGGANYNPSINITREDREAFQVAIDTMRKYQQLQADYENRLKADLVAMLEDLDLQIDELSYKQRPFTWDDTGEKGMMDINPSINDVRSLIQERIGALQGGENQ